MCRLYQGSLTKGDQVVNTRSGKRVRVSTIARMHSNEMEHVDQVFAGILCQLSIYIIQSNYYNFNSLAINI